MNGNETVRVTVTGAHGFIGTNFVMRLRECADIVLTELDVDNTVGDFDRALEGADYVFHLAGVNRSRDPAEFESGNHGLTRRIVDRLRQRGRPPVLVATSSVQAAQQNPYGVSKRAAEDELFSFSAETSAPTYVYRLPNVFGKWTKPFYNSAVATFCHQVATGATPSVHDPSASLHLVYIDDVIDSFLEILNGREPIRDGRFSMVVPEYQTTVGEVAEIIGRFPAIRTGGCLPDLSDGLSKALYSMYLTYLPEDVVSYVPPVKSDDRGYLFELVKSDFAGQLFVSRTKPGITRGNHYHHTKVEKFCVVEGVATIRLRHLVTSDEIAQTIEGTECRIMDIPPGYTHSITNVGDRDLVTLFWANEVFDPRDPDTYYCEV